MTKTFTYHLFLLFFLLGISTIMVAQNGTISGKIVDEKKEPIFMATIVLKGTTIGTTTDFDGNYNISAKAGTYNVEISFIGLKTQTQSVTIIEGKETRIDATLKADVLMLDEAVVIGFGRRQKRDVTGSIAQISPKDMGTVNVTSVENIMQGRASGIQVTAANGTAGAAIKVNIRGTNSIAAGSQPLYIIDGMQMSVQDIDPNDIESISVLKDASSAAIYGARGSNGVVLIQTKKGKEGETKFTANYKTGIIKETNRLELLSAKEHLALRDSAGLNDSPTTNLGSSAYVWTRAQADSLAELGGTDWIDEVLRTGFMQEANVSVAGGSEKTTFYFSGTYKKEEGFLVGNAFERINARVNITNKASSKLDVGINFGISNSKNDKVPIGDAGGLGLAQQKFPYMPIYNSDGSYFDPANNPLWQLDNWSLVSNNFRTISKIYADYKFNENLKFKSEFGIDVLSQFDKEFKFRNIEDATSTSYASEMRNFVSNWSTNQYFSYDKNFNENSNLSIQLGTTFQKTKISGSRLSGYDFVSDYIKVPGLAQNVTGESWLPIDKTNSFFTRAFYKLKNKYLMSFSLRTDGSSKFGLASIHDIPKIYGLFPAISTGWIISDEEFLKNNNLISYLKLNTSYGFTGNSNIPYYSQYGYYSTTLGYNGHGGIYPSNLENPELSWEKSKQLDITVDYGFLENKISGNITIFNKRTTDMLTPVILPTSSGYGIFVQNIGKMNNKGLEMSVNTKQLNKKLKWSTDFNISIIRNKVLDVGGLEPDAFELGQPGEGRAVVGYAVGTAYVVKYAGVQQEDATLIVYDLNGNQVLNNDGSVMTTQVKKGDDVYYDVNGNLMSYDHPSFYDNRVPMGSPTPKFYGGINNRFEYRNFDLNFLISFVYGNTIYDDPAKQQLGAFQNIAQRPELLDEGMADIRSNYQAVNSSKYLYDGSYIRLRNISIGYNFSKEKCKQYKISELRIYLSATNLFLLTNYPSWDPEVLRDIDTEGQHGNVSFAGPSYQTPQAKTYNIGIQVQF